MKSSLYFKLFSWQVLNLLLLAALAVGIFVWLLFGNSQNLVPAYIFSSNVENKLREISMNLQYRNINSWRENIESHNQTNGPFFHMVDMDQPDFIYYTSGFVPEKVLQASRMIPRTPFTLCTDPVGIFSKEHAMLADYNESMESGLAPIPPALFVRTKNPVKYWYGRTVFIPDSAHKAHHVLLAVEANTLTGGGLYFNFTLITSVALLMILVSCLWWWPFIVYLTRPILTMVGYAEKIANHPSTNNQGIAMVFATPSMRGDEIGRLGQALYTMAQKLTQQVTGQQQFIKHIAHELKTPLARSKLALAVLEQRLDGDSKEKAASVTTELENLSRLTKDVLSFLREQPTPVPAKLECLNLGFHVTKFIHERYFENNIVIEIDANLMVRGDISYIRQALGNVVDNSLLYAGELGPVTLMTRADFQRNKVELIILDHGPGVCEDDLVLLTEPFFRGINAQLSYPGGSGLGLSIAKNSLSQCGAELRIENIKDGFAVIMVFDSCE